MLTKEKKANSVLKVKLASEQFKIQKMNDLADGYEAEMLKAMEQSRKAEEKLHRLQDEFKIKY